MNIYNIFTDTRHRESRGYCRCVLRDPGSTLPSTSAQSRGTGLQGRCLYCQGQGRSTRDVRETKRSR